MQNIGKEGCSPLNTNLNTSCGGTRADSRLPNTRAPGASLPAMPVLLWQVLAPQGPDARPEYADHDLIHTE